MTPAFIQAVLDGRRAEAEGLLDILLADGWPDNDDYYLRLWHKD